jgi:hypothetical protein
MDSTYPKNMAVKVLTALYVYPEPLSNPAKTWEYACIRNQRPSLNLQNPRVTNHIL